MRVVRFDEAVAFRERVWPLLLEREVENSLLIGILGRLAQEGPTAYGNGAPANWTVEDASGPVAVAVITPPHFLNLTRAEPPAVEALAEDLRRSGLLPPGVMGPAQAADRFAECWARLIITHGAA